MSAVGSSGMPRQQWRAGASLLPERRPQLFSAHGTELAALPCFAWNATALAARGADVWLSAWRAAPADGWGAAEFVLARGREAEYERSRPVSPVPDISLADVVRQAMGEGSASAATPAPTPPAEPQAGPPPPPLPADAAAAAAADGAPAGASLLYHAGPMETWGDALGSEAEGLYRAFEMHDGACRCGLQTPD